MDRKLSASGANSDLRTRHERSDWNTIDDRSFEDRLDAEQLFEALDGRTVKTASGIWSIEIQSIYDEGPTRWIQLALAGNPQYALTFRLHDGNDADDALRAISMWLAGTEPQHVM